MKTTQAAAECLPDFHPDTCLLYWRYWSGVDFGARYCQWQGCQSPRQSSVLAEQVEPYVAHRPKETLLYQLVEKYYPQLKAELLQQGSPLPRYVEQEFEAYLQCGCAEHGFFVSVRPRPSTKANESEEP